MSGDSQAECEAQGLKEGNGWLGILSGHAW